MFLIISVSVLVSVFGCCVLVFLYSVMSCFISCFLFCVMCLCVGCDVFGNLVVMLMNG